jgi:hypothetical protein
MKKAIWTLLLTIGLLGNFPLLCLADEVTDWNVIMLDALRTGDYTRPAWRQTLLCEFCFSPR